MSYYTPPPQPTQPATVIIQQRPSHRSRPRRSRGQRSRSPQPPVTIIQQPSYQSRPYYQHQPRSRSPSPGVTHQSHSTNHPRFIIPPRSRSPSPVPVIVQPHSSSRRRRRRSNSAPIIIPQPHSRTSYHSGSGPQSYNEYQRQDSRPQPQPPVVVMPASSYGESSHSRYSRPSSPQVVVMPSYPHGGQPVVVVQGSSTYGSSRSASNPQNDQTAYTAVDPFRPSVASSLNFGPSHAQPEYYYDIDYKTQSHSYAPYSVARRTAWKTLLADSFQLFWRFFIVTLPGQIYLYFLLKLPSFYFSRVARIFEEADMTMAEIKDLPYTTLGPMAEPNAKTLDWDASIPALNSRLKSTWESFIDSLLREWKTLNIVSVLLMTCVSSNRLFYDC
jgi:hypothetical protein